MATLIGKPAQVSSTSTCSVAAEDIGGLNGWADSTCCPGCNPTHCYYNEAFRALGPPEWPISDPLPTGSPGEGGEFVFKFNHVIVVDGPGADLRFWQANAFGGVPEESIISVSEDGISFVTLSPNLNDSVHTGQDPVTGYFFDFDIRPTGLSALQYVRVVDVLGNCDGSDIDAIEALNFEIEQPPECEPSGDADGDGVLNDEDDCPDSDLSPTIVIDECDTSVENQLLEDGCTMADLIALCAEGVTEHGAFVRCVGDVPLIVRN